MRSKYILALLMIISCHLSYGQTSNSLLLRADSLYSSKSYPEAGRLYVQVANQGWLNNQRNTSFYNAACCYSRIGDKDAAFRNLRLAIKTGYRNKTHILVDSDLENLHQDSRWAPLINSVVPIQPSGNPRSSKLITSDIGLFYKAFRLAIKDTANAAHIFKEKYFLKGSIGLQDFFRSKIRDTEIFAKFVLKNKDFYQSIESRLIKSDQLKEDIYSNFEKFKKLYPDAVFPNVYFVIGRVTSNGTASENGLLIGAELLARTDANAKLLNKKFPGWLMDFNHIPITVMHEIVHFNQGGLANEKTLLRYAITEGSAEFIDELITGKTDGGYNDFRRREKAIWLDFKKAMYSDTYDDWLMAQEPKRPRNGMYWAGYLICKSYYNQADDKVKAVRDILNIQDYKTFYEKSKVDDYIDEAYSSN